MNKILIIGGCGFIGSHLLDFYKGLDEFEAYNADIIIDYAADKYYFNIGSQKDFYSIFEDIEFDFCINASGAANVRFSFEEPLKDYSLNTQNVFYILDAIRTFQPNCKLLTLSSAAVYGNPKQLPIKVTDPTMPMSPYGWHKLQSEMLCTEFNQNFNVRSAVARIFSAYGEGLKKQLFWDMHINISSTGKLDLYGTGQESRDFIYIKDLVDALHAIIKSSEFGANAYNVASGIEVNIASTAEIFTSFYDKEIPIKFSGEEKIGDPKNWVADISDLISFGFKAKYDMQIGLEQYYKWVIERK